MDATVGAHHDDHHHHDNKKQDWSLQLVDQDDTLRLDLRLESQLQDLVAAGGDKTTAPGTVPLVEAGKKHDQLYKVETLACMQGSGVQGVRFLQSDIF